MKKLNKKGFTLAELLIVVAIIAVLVAIAIPVFSNAVAKAAIAADAANIRAAYAEVQVAKIDSTMSKTGDATKFKAQTDSTIAADSKVLTSKTGGFTVDLPAPAATAITIDKGTTYTVDINDAGKITITGS